jgi:PAS domain S-box-containing protein
MSTPLQPPVADIASRLRDVPDPLALLETLFDVAPVAFQLYRADGHSLLVNPAFKTLFGSEPPPEYNVLHDDIAARAGLLDLIRRAFAGETVRLPPTWYDPRELERVKVSEGRRVSIETTFCPLRNRSGELTHVIAVFIDRTEVEAERDLLLAIVEQCAEGIIVADADGRIKLFNRAAEEQHGALAAGIKAESWSDAFGLRTLDGEKLPLEDTPLHRALRGERVADARWVVIRPDGDRRTLAGSAAPLRHRDGTPAGGVLVSRDDTERHAVEEALRRSEERYRGILASLAEGITIQDKDGVLVESNAGAARLFGLAVDEMKGRTSHSREWGAVDENGEPLPGDRHPAMIALRTGVPQTNVVVGVDRVDGKRVWLSINAHPLFRPGTDERVGVVSSFFDITQQREVAEERTRLLALAKAGEEQFRTLADTMPVLAWYAEPDGYIPWYNKRWHEYTGKPLDEQAGWKWESVHDPADLPRVVAKWKASLASGVPFDDQFRLLGKDGVFRWFLTRVEPLRDETGRIVRWFGTNVDIDEQKRAEHWLRILAEAAFVLAPATELRTRLENVARLVVPSLGDWSAIFSTDDAGAAQVVAVAHADAAEEPALRALLSTRATARWGLDTVLRTGKPVVWGREPETNAPVDGSRDPTGDGRLHPNSSIVVPLKVTGRNFGALMLAATTTRKVHSSEERVLVEELGRRVALAIDTARLLEVTQRERQRAEEANRAKDEFLSVASHELRTPLNAILGWARLLSAGSVPEDRREHALRVIERNAVAQVQLVEDILDVSRIITGKLRLEIGPTDVAQVVDAATDVVRPAAAAKGVRLHVVVDPDATMMMADAARLQQVIWNLLANAVKFTPAGGDVRVHVRREGGRIELVVADSGQGIDPTFAPHLFEPFRQADGSSTRAHGGLGLGLAIVKHVVELHGGRVGARSEGPRKGATFTVQIPVGMTHAREAPRAASPGTTRFDADRSLVRPPELERLTIVVVDDEPDARDLLRSILEHCGAVVRTAASAGEAFDAILREPPQIVLSDLGMPDADGYELIRRVRALAPEQGGRVPAIAITAYARSDDRARALMAGFTNHIAKPVDPQELVAVVAAAVAPR